MKFNISGQTSGLGPCFSGTLSARRGRNGTLANAWPLYS